MVFWFPQDKGCHFTKQITLSCGLLQSAGAGEIKEISGKWGRLKLQRIGTGRAHMYARHPADIFIGNALHEGADFLLGDIGSAVSFLELLKLSDDSAGKVLFILALDEIRPDRQIDVESIAQAGPAFV